MCSLPRKPVKENRFLVATVDDALLQTLDSFSAAEFEQVVLVNASQRKRNPVFWEALLSPQVIERTHNALAQAVQRNSAAMSARRPDEHGGTSAPDPGYVTWRRSAVSFGHIVQGALQEVNQRRKMLVQQGDLRSAERYRRNIRDIALALADHQDAIVRSGTTPRPEDLKLWESLDTVRLPHGSDSTPTSLRELVATVWYPSKV